MSVIQIVILAFAVFAIAGAARRHQQGHLGRFWLVAWVAFWIVAVAVSLKPDVTTTVAGWFGVGRGVDLVFYISLLVLFYLLFRMFMRIEGLEREITRLVRELALGRLSDDSSESE